jgi:hypothetical protein
LHACQPVIIVIRIREWKQPRRLRGLHARRQAAGRVESVAGGIESGRAANGSGPISAQPLPIGARRAAALAATESLPVVAMPDRRGVHIAIADFGWPVHRVVARVVASGSTQNAVTGSEFLLRAPPCSLWLSLALRIAIYFLLHSQQLPDTSRSFRPALMLFLTTKEAAPMRLTPRQATCFTPWVPPDPNPYPKNRQPVLNVMNSLCKNLWKSRFAGEKSGFTSPRHPKSLRTLNRHPPNKLRKPGKSQEPQAKSGGSQAKSQVKPKNCQAARASGDRHLHRSDRLPQCPRGIEYCDISFPPRRIAGRYGRRSI